MMRMPPIAASLSGSAEASPNQSDYLIAILFKNNLIHKAVRRVYGQTSKQCIACKRPVLSTQFVMFSIGNTSIYRS